MTELSCPYVVALLLSKPIKADIDQYKLDLNLWSSIFQVFNNSPFTLTNKYNTAKTKYLTVCKNRQVGSKIVMSTQYFENLQIDH